MLPGRRPVRPSRCRNEATVRGRVDLDDPVEVADVDAELQGAGGDDDAVARLGERLLGAAPLVDGRARRARRTSSTPAPAAAAPSSSTGCRESQKTSRFSPRCRAAMTVAALSRRADVVELDVAGRRRAGRRPHGQVGCDDRARPPPAPEPCSQSSSSSGLPTVADRPIRWTGRPASRLSRSSTASRCQPRSSPAKACTSSTTTARTSAEELPRGRRWRRRASPPATRAWSAGCRAGRRRIAPPGAGGDVAVPERGPAAQPAGVALAAAAAGCSAAPGAGRRRARDSAAPVLARPSGTAAGSSAASVLPPAVGASSSASSPVEQRRRRPAPAAAAAPASRGS